MQNSKIGTGFRRGGLIALAITTIITSACGGGGGGGSSASTANGSTGSTGNDAAATANSAPTISAAPTTEAAVGSAYTLSPQANDADGDTLAFSIQNKPVWAEFSTTTGQLSGTPNAQSTGATSDIVISVSDGKASAALPSFSITVAATVAGPASPAETPAEAPVADPSASPGVSAGAGVALSWDVPTRTIDGETLANLSGYRIHYGTSANAMVRAIEIQSSGANNFTVQDLPAGTYYFAVRAITSAGVQSKLSNVITRVVS
jgi:hypothetical protein